MARWKVTTLYCLGFLLGSIFSLTHHRGPLDERMLGLALLIGLWFYLLERRFKPTSEEHTVSLKRSDYPAKPRRSQDL